MGGIEVGGVQHAFDLYFKVLDAGLSREMPRKIMYRHRVEGRDDVADALDARLA